MKTDPQSPGDQVLDTVMQLLCKSEHWPGIHRGIKDAKGTLIRGGVTAVAAEQVCGFIEHFSSIAYFSGLSDQKRHDVLGGLLDDAEI